MASVDSTIGELHADGKQTMIVFNKIDAVPDREIVAKPAAPLPGSVAISARTGEGMDSFFEELELRLSAWRMRGEFLIPLSESALMAELHRVGHVLSVTYEGDAALVTAHVLRKSSTALPHLKPLRGPEAMSILKGILLTLVCFSLVACANLGSSGSQSSMRRASLYDPKPVKVETGIASWYNDRRTASGERFDKKKALAAAHKKLPFGSKVRVVDLKTNKSIIVRINDRGPYKRGA